MWNSKVEILLVHFHLSTFGNGSTTFHFQTNSQWNVEHCSIDLVFFLSINVPGLKNIQAYKTLPATVQHVAWHQGVQGYEEHLLPVLHQVQTVHMRSLVSPTKYGMDSCINTYIHNNYNYQLIFSEPLVYM